MGQLRSIGSSTSVSVSVSFYFGCMKYHGASRDAVIRSLPFAFDFNATLRCAMAKSRVLSGQRAVTILAQDQEPDRGLFVSGCVGRFMGKAAGEAVHRA